jgi:hypothetical protein
MRRFFIGCVDKPLAELGEFRISVEHSVDSKRNQRVPRHFFGRTLIEGARDGFLQSRTVAFVLANYGNKFLERGLLGCELLRVGDSQVLQHALRSQKFFMNIPTNDCGVNRS